MLSNLSPVPVFRRHVFGTLRARLEEPARFIQVVAGPRQTGKTTLVRQVVADLGVQTHFASADDPGMRDGSWLEAQWEVGRTLARATSGESAVLVLDEIQKIPVWSETAKRLWDSDAAAGLKLRVVLLGSAPLLVQRGLADSLAGRFEVIRLTHWSLVEMSEAFGFDLERFLFFGGYPGAAALVDDLERWRAYILDSHIETALSRDIMLLERVDKPALLRQLFRLGCDYSGQIISYQKLTGQLQDAGNTTTLAHYLRLLSGAGLLTGLEKYAGSVVRQRGSSPKLLALNTGLITAMSAETPESVGQGGDFRGRLVESAVGAHLINGSPRDVTVTWWRERDREVDFVVEGRGRLLAIEVASGRRKGSLPRMGAFMRLHRHATPLLIGAQGLPLDVALSTPVENLLGIRPVLRS